MRVTRPKKTTALICAAFLIPTLATLGLLAGMFWSRHSRSVVLKDLRYGETQTVSIAFSPYRWRWSISGRIDGSGVVIVEHAYSNRVSGSFAASGSGDYYATNASVAFIPDGAASGKISGSFWFHDWY